MSIKDELLKESTRIEESDKWSYYVSIGTYTSPSIDLSFKTITSGIQIDVLSSLFLIDLEKQKRDKIYKEIVKYVESIEKETANEIKDIVEIFYELLYSKIIEKSNLVNAHINELLDKNKDLKWV